MARWGAAYQTQHSSQLTTFLFSKLISAAWWKSKKYPERKFNCRPEKILSHPTAAAAGVAAAVVDQFLPKLFTQQQQALHAFALSCVSPPVGLQCSHSAKSLPKPFTSAFPQILRIKGGQGVPELENKGSTTKVQRTLSAQSFSKLRKNIAFSYAEKTFS